MAHILHIDTSPRGDRSITRKLASDFVQAWKGAHPGDTYTYRDLGHNPVPFVDEPWIAASFSPPDTHTPELAQAIKVSDELVDEFLAADRYVLDVPMYNFGVPAVFKAYIDQIIRVGRTFTVTDEGFKGLIEPGRKILIISAHSGVYDPGTPAAAVDFHEPYLRALFGFIGITDLTFVKAQGLAFGDEYRDQSIAAAEAALTQAVTNW